MRDNRYKEELNKIEFELMKRNLSNEIIKKEESMYVYRQKLKELILNSIDDKNNVKLIDAYNEKKFLKEYKSYVLKTRMLYPKFVFDEYDEDKFKECVDLKKQGYTLQQIEEYYLNELCNKKKQKICSVC